MINDCNKIDQHDTYSIADKNEAAKTIQKYFRGHLVRKSLLPSVQYPQYRSLCQEALSNPYTMPQAQAGKTTVFLPPKMPGIVLKHSGKREAIKRFHQMQEVRAVLNSQKIAHLIIPRATLCQDFLIEQRLPINPENYHNMGLYLSQPEVFDEAVREMTRLFSKRYLSDLFNYQRFSFKNSKIDDSVRYDNLPLFISGKEGNIGLIDLEHIRDEPDEEGLEALVRIFPYHLEIIKEEAKKLNMKIEDAILKSAAIKGKAYLQAEFSEPLEWLNQKDVSRKIVFQPFEMSPQRLKELVHTIEEELLKINQGHCILKQDMGYFGGKVQGNFILKDSKKIHKLAEDISSKLLQNLKTLLEESYNKNISKLSGQEVTDSELVSLRSVFMNRLRLYEGLGDLIYENEGIKFEKVPQERGIAEQLAYVLLKELEKNNEIYFFDPGYLTGGHNVCWVRY